MKDRGGREERVGGCDKGRVEVREGEAVMAGAGREKCQVQKKRDGEEAGLDYRGTQGRRGASRP